MMTVNRDYLEERAQTLSLVGEHQQATGRGPVAIDACVDRLTELVSFGEELIDVLTRASLGGELERLREWLAEDLRQQRRLLAQVRSHDPSEPPSSESAHRH